MLKKIGEKNIKKQEDTKHLVKRKCRARVVEFK